jgi:bla regulator protein BlaR1
MRLHHSFVLAALLAAAPAAPAAQSPEPSFDAVSIKRNTSAAGSSSLGLPIGSAFNMTNMSMLGAISTAYPVKNPDIIGAPDWLRTDRYDIVAKAPGKPTREEVTAMLRTMMRERLKLAAHVESREIPVYALVVAQPNHPGLKAFTQDCDAIRAARNAPTPEGRPSGPPPPGTAPPCGYAWSTAIFAGGITMETLAGMLDRQAGRVVLDRTGLPGRYEFTLRFAPTGSSANGADDPPSIFTALQEQLGLRLEPARAPVDTLVIEHIERPSDD